MIRYDERTVLTCCPGPNIIILSAAITFIVIVVGYLSDSLPDATLTQFDLAFLSRYSIAKWRPWTRNRLLDTLLTRSMNLLIAPTAISLDDQASSDEKRLRANQRRSESLQRFILALSDQQLITGLAVLIAGFWNRCTMPLYYFSIIASVAWFSSTTHLSTLAILRVYLIDHPRVRDWRVVAMLCVAALLSVAQLGSYSDLDGSLPVEYALRAEDGAGDISFWLVLAFLCLSYSQRIARLYSADPDWTVLNWCTDIWTSYIKKGNRDTTILSNINKIGIASLRVPKGEQGIAIRILRQRQRYAERFSLLTNKEASMKLPAMLRRSIPAPIMIKTKKSGLIFVWDEIFSSFLDDIMASMFGIFFGITQTVAIRSNGAPAAGILGDQNSMQLGQLVPLLFILLPILTAGETYSGRQIAMIRRSSTDTLRQQSAITAQKPILPLEVLRG